MSTCGNKACDTVPTAVGPVPRLATTLTGGDILGAVRVRCNLGRMSYSVPPGLYAVGQPNPESPVLVTGNYKLTVDLVRKELSGVNAWILALDTKGINVWCAAGKGTFGTDELVGRVAAVRLAEVVTHRELILPQLGAPGVAAPELPKRCGFRAMYGPVYARDIPAFLTAGKRATPNMRRVDFSWIDRLLVVPVELTLAFRYLLLAALALWLIAGLLAGGWPRAGGLLLLTGSAFIGGTVVTPLLLPWLPGRMFAVKGAVVGVALIALLHVTGFLAASCGVRSVREVAAWWFLIPAISSFLAMNFTGATTFTSQSGVVREMRQTMPFIVLGAIAGILLFVVAQLGQRG